MLESRPFSYCAFVLTAALAGCSKDKPAPAPAPSQVVDKTPKANPSADLAAGFAKPTGACQGPPSQGVCTEFFADSGKETCARFNSTWIPGGHCAVDDKLLGTCEVTADMGADLIVPSKKVYFQFDAEPDVMQGSLESSKEICKLESDENDFKVTRVWKDGPAVKAKAAAAKSAAPPQ